MKFFVTLILILILGYTYLGLRLCRSPLEWLLLFLPIAPVVSFAFYRENIFLLNLCFLSMGFLSFLLVFSLIRDASLLLPIRDLGRMPVILLATFALTVGHIKAKYGVVLRDIDVPVRDLSPGLKDLKIVHLSDIHVGPTIGAEFVGKIVERVNELDPDLVVLTGDIGDGDIEKFREEARPLEMLRSKHGVFYVPGNHEYYSDAGAWMKFFASLGMKVLVNRGENIEIAGQKVFVGGVPDPVSGEILNPRYPLKDADPAASLKLLLSHRSEVAEETGAENYDLIFAGHTHGGQFFPWTIIAYFAHKYYVGLYAFGEKSHIYVSPGTGSWGPLVRLGTTPEIAVLNLR